MADLNDEAVDELLESPNADYLRLFRNGTFHYQPDVFSPKLVNFMDSEDSVEWVKRLHSRLGEFLLESIKAHIPADRREAFQAELDNTTTELRRMGLSRNEFRLSRKVQRRMLHLVGSEFEAGRGRGYVDVVWSSMTRSKTLGAFLAKLGDAFARRA